MRCPQCDTDFKPEDSASKPFCSERCRTIDLGRWLDESYALPHVPDPEDDEAPDDDWSQEVRRSQENWSQENWSRESGPNQN